MDILKRNFAPLSKEAWTEIDGRATDVFRNYLSARKLVHVDGPKGLEFAALPIGRLTEMGENDGVASGIYEVKPLVETRVQFELDRWELDNLARGAKDVDLAPLEEAVKKAALYEERAIYSGLDAAGIKGLTQAAEGEAITFGKDGSSIMEAISAGVLRLEKAYAPKPYTLVVGEEAWKRINREIPGYPLLKRIEELTGSPVVVSHALDSALLLPQDHEDLELTLGQDFAIGYETHDTKSVRLFLLESFTFRVLDPAIVVKYRV